MFIERPPAEIARKSLTWLKYCAASTAEWDIDSHTCWTDWLIANHDFKGEGLPGRIGGGSKVHRLWVVSRIVRIPFDEYGHTGIKVIRQVADCRSFCGSQRWNPNGYGHLFLLDDESTITCKRCTR